MSAEPESPADEYERRLEERREAARPTIDGSLVYFVVLHSLALLFGLSLAMLGCMALLVFLVLWTASVAPVGVLLAVLARNWTALTLGQRAACLAPAAFLLAEMSLPAVILTFRTLL